MKKRLIILITIILMCGMIVKSQEKWSLKAIIGTNYAVTEAAINENRTYTKNFSWYPGVTLGANISYDVFSWLSLESGINYEKIRTGYKMGIYGQSGSFNQSYSKDYLNVPVLLQAKISPHFGLYGGSGYRFCLSKSEGVEEYMDWNEWLITGGFFVQIKRVRTSLSYTQGTSEKSFVYFSQNRTISLIVSYTLWQK